jgi:hypothetical protein
VPRISISKEQAITAGLQDVVIDQQLLEEAQSDADSFDFLEHEHIRETVEEQPARRAILAGVDPIRFQRFTRREHRIAIEQLDPPITPAERRELDLLFCVQDDNAHFDRIDQEETAWRSRRQQTRGIFSQR